MHGCPASRVRMNLLNSFWASLIQSDLVLSDSRFARSARRDAWRALFSACSFLARVNRWAQEGPQTHCMGLRGVKATPQPLALHFLGLRVADRLIRPPGTVMGFLQSARP